jgi:hypothetical protein
MILSHRRLRAALRAARGYIGARTFPRPNDRERRLRRALDQTLDEAKSAAVAMGISGVPLSQQQIDWALGPLIESPPSRSNGAASS